MNPFCRTKCCPFNKWNKDDKNSILHEFGDSIVYVPREVMTDGHVLLIPRKHIKDITDPSTRILVPCLLVEINHVCEFLKTELSNINKKVERIYVATLSEFGRENSHLHFHLIPRYKGDRTGFEFMALKECEVRMLGEKNLEKRRQEQLKKMQKIDWKELDC